MGAFIDPRVEQYARLLVERSLDVQPGWQVLIRTQPEARPLIEELIRLIAERGAYPLLRMNFTLFPNDEPWAGAAPVELVGEIAPIDLYASDHMDARITVEAPDNTRGVAEMSSERRALMRKAAAPFFRRTMADEIPWVGCQFPTNAYAQEAGMPLAAFEDFFYDALEAFPGAGEVDVRCEAGRMTLTGRVQHKKLKRDIGEIGWNTPGVNDVQNNVTITGRRRSRGAGREQEPPSASRKPA